jgi:sugar lactone lactonase YvrE
MSDGCFHVRTDALGAPTAGLWPGGTILANNFISWVAWDPTNLNVAYATVSNFGVTNVFKTTNAGVSWAPAVGSGAGALPQIPALSVAVNPNNGSQVFVGTDLGVFTSNDGGASWMVENTGFARTPVEALKFDQAGTRLFAFTHGRGAWRTQLCTTCRSIGGNVSGLTAGNSVQLRLNGGPALVVGANGSFVFGTPVADGGAYAVTVLTQPTTPNQVCVVANGAGTVAGANVTNVAVTCTTTTYTIGGTVGGLAPGNSVVLRNNGGNDLTVNANGSFVFGTPVADGGAYAVTVLTQPTTPNQVCVVASGAGTVAGANVTNVVVTCTTTTYTIGGTVSGLAAGNSVVLRNNGGNDLTISANGAFTFATPVEDGGAYAVTVSTQPGTPPQICTVTGGSGTVAGANVGDVAVACALIAIFSNGFEPPL